MKTAIIKNCRFALFIVLNYHFNGFLDFKSTMCGARVSPMVNVTLYFASAFALVIRRESLLSPFLRVTG